MSTLRTFVDPLDIQLVKELPTSELKKRFTAYALEYGHLEDCPSRVGLYF